MLSQNDVVGYLRKNPEQHVAFQILSAYIFSKSSRGNLPSETLAKILTISHKLSVVNGPLAAGAPVARAFEAAKTALILANRSWISQGPRALGALGEVGSASTPDAIAAWTKATDGKVKIFDDGTRSSLSGQAIDAGRVIGPRHRMATDLEAPPMYEPQPEPETDTNGQVEAQPAPDAGDRVAEDDALAASGEQSTVGVRAAVAEAVAAEPPQAQAQAAEDDRSQLDLEQGRSNLAKLRLALLEKQQKEDDLAARSSQRPTEDEPITANTQPERP